jgi:transposase
MAGRGRLGPVPDVEKRERFARLIAEGVSNRRACQLVGIARKTGTRWRLGRTITLPDGRTRHYPAVVSRQRREISSRYLSEDERVRIADLRQAGLGVRAIAGQLGRSPSTVSRELRRNCDASGQYRPFTAQRLAAAAGPARPGGSSTLIRCCASSWPAGWRKGGARSRSATRCAPSSPASRGGIWCRRRSIRRSTGRSWAGCAGSCPAYCGLAGAAAGPAAGRTPAGQAR